VLTSEARKLGVSIFYDHKITDILTDGPEGAPFRFSNGTEISAFLLVGADGIHSQVRQVGFPDAPAPTYTGQAGMSWSIPRQSLKYPPVVSEAFLAAGALSILSCGRSTSSKLLVDG
jgi:2-polyprenyl-6-methoxyphenol hydroxylase-like FAD-dependent oxidoreductase